MADVQIDHSVKKVLEIEPDLLHFAELEVRHLKDTITVLREQLEQKDFEKSVAVQQAVQSSYD